MEQVNRVRGQDKGRTGLAIGGHVRQARARLGIDLADLSSRLDELKWPIAKSALSRLENGQRRVDVDDLMALSVALYVSPLELLLGEFERTVLPTSAPSGMVAPEIWAWAAGEVELDSGELLSWWQAHLAGLRLQYESQQSLLERPPQHIGDTPARSLRRLREQVEATRREIEQAVARISQLGGEGEVAGIMWDELPPDPTVAVTQSVSE